MAEETTNFTISQTEKAFGKKTRVFCPFVRLLPYEEYYELAYANMKSYEETPLQPAIDDACDAFQFYLDNYHSPGRPYVFFGQGQGSLVLYEALKRMKNITPEDGFVAAYFSGLPPRTSETMLEDFKNRPIVPANGQFDTGVLIAWDPIEQSAPKPDYALSNAYVMNPISWKTDTTPASADDNPYAVFYNCLFPVRIRLQTIKNPAGATIDPSIGCIRFKLNSTMDEVRSQVFFHDSQYYADRHCIFLGSIVSNARERVREYIFKHNWKK